MRGRHSALTAILLGGTVAGIVDIGAASAINGFIDPILIMKFIAGGLVGPATQKAGGLEMALLGLLLQVGMSMIIAAIFVLASSVLPILKRQWLPAGIAFGVPVFFTMEYVVMPMSAIHRIPSFTTQSFVLNMLAMMVFGVIIAWFNRAATRPSLATA